MGNSFLLSSSFPDGINEEICDNAVDDDLDGLIDLNDPDCICEVIEPISLIPNPSFEEMDCCPEDRSQLDCASGWIQASEPTTDYLHYCGWMGWEEFPPPLPFPDGEGAMGFRDGRVRNNQDAEPGWKEYAGACLNEPLTADSTYRFEFYVGFVSFERSPPIKITFFGTPDCEYLPFGVGNESFGCPTNGPGWVELGAVSVSGGEGDKWVHTFIEVTPEVDIAAMAIGPGCNLSTNPVSTYYFFDDLVLDDLESFELAISENGHPCSELFYLEVPSNDDYNYQWFKDGIALIGETSPQLSEMYGEGDYAVQILDGTGSCRISQAFAYEIPTFSSFQAETICHGEEYLFGNQYLNASGFYQDTIKTPEGCDHFMSLSLEVVEALSDTISARIFESEEYTVGNNSFMDEGIHFTNLISREGCDSLVVLNLSYYNIFIPNVFSPNDDGINDQFTAYSINGDILDQELSIFDRWGNNLFTGSKWDGQSQGESVNPGVYIYVFKLKMSDGVERQFSGAVTVLK